MGWNKVVRLKMTSEGRVCLRLADVKRYGVPYFGCKRERQNKGYVAEQKVKPWTMQVTGNVISAERLTSPVECTLWGRQRPCVPLRRLSVDSRLSLRRLRCVSLHAACAAAYEHTRRSSLNCSTFHNPQPYSSQTPNQLISHLGNHRTHSFPQEILPNSAG